MITSKEKYRNFCTVEKDIPIFSKDWWLDSVCGNDNWDVIIIEKGGQIMASMPYYLTKKRYFTSISKPILTQSIGVYIKYPENQKYYKKLSWEKKLINDVLMLLPKHDIFSQRLYYKNDNILPFYWAGFDLTPKITYIIENVTMEELEKKHETDIRRRRRKKAKNNDVSVIESHDIEEFYNLNKQTYKRQNKPIPYSFNFIKNLHDKCSKNNSCKMFFAKDTSGDIIAGNFLIYDKNTVYYLMGGINPDKSSLGGMDVVLYESIKFALHSNRRFDFEGSMIESIEKYFRSFGAKQETYYELTKINSKLYNKLRTIKSIFS